MTADDPCGQYRHRLRADQVFLACIAVFPLFFLSLDGWMSGVFYCTAALAGYILVRDMIQKAPIVPPDACRPWVSLLLAALAAPLIAVFLGQLFRQDFSWRYYDSPSRLLFSVSVLLVVAHKRINVAALFEYTIPAALFIALGSVMIKPGTTWQASRVTTYFVDPLTFGSVALTFGLMSLMAIDLSKQDSFLFRCYKIAGFATGMFLSVLSESRTGWLSIPIVFAMWGVSRRFKYKAGIVTLAGVMVFMASATVYHSSSGVHEKVNLAFSELLAYRWDAVNPDDHSVSMRISFWRMALYFFAQNPLGGWGDTGFKVLIDAPEIAQYASQYTRQYALGSGFHNEILTNVVRSGVWGAIAHIAVLLTPLCFFIRMIFSPCLLTRNLALFSFSYMICTIASAMSTEVLNLKFTTAFHALMIASLCGSLLIFTNSDPEGTSR